MKVTGCFILLGLSLFFLTSFGYASELSKSEATKLLTFMGYTNVVVAAVVNGVGMGGEFAAPVGSPNCAFVIGYGEQHGERFAIRQTFLFDKEIGWFTSSPGLTANKKLVIKLWTVQGYRELGP
jgi:hypothetical protein